MIITAIINRKGGVGKTVTTANLAYSLTLQGKRVLMVDADSQCNLSRLFRVPLTARTTIADIYLNSASTRRAIRKTRYDNLHILPGDERLEALKDIHESTLLWALNEVKEEYDICLIDCPPSMQLSTVNILIAADHVMVPMELDSFSLSGVLALDRLIEQCREYNEGIELLGVVITKYRSNRGNNEMIRGMLEQPLFPMMETVIRYDTKVSHSIRVCKPLMKCASKGKAAMDYLELANEYLEKVGM